MQQSNKSSVCTLMVLVLYTTMFSSCGNQNFTKESASDTTAVDTAKYAVDTVSLIKQVVEVEPEPVISMEKHPKLKHNDAWNLYGLYGHVRSVKIFADYDTTHVEFDRDGTIHSLDGHQYKRDAKGRVVKEYWKYKLSDFYAEWYEHEYGEVTLTYSYNSKGQMSQSDYYNPTGLTDGPVESRSTYSYRGDDMVKENYEGRAGEQVLKYVIKKRDDMGNWTRRDTKYDDWDGTNSVIRKIEYWTE